MRHSHVEKFEIKCYNQVMTQSIKDLLQNITKRLDSIETRISHVEGGSEVKSQKTQKYQDLLYQAPEQTESNNFDQAETRVLTPALASSPAEEDPLTEKEDLMSHYFGRSDQDQIAETKKSDALTEKGLENPASDTVTFSTDNQIPPKQPKLDSEESLGRWIGKIGVIAIVAGFIFFLKYAFDNNIITELGRIILGFVTGGLFVALGFVLSKKYAVYRDTLAAGGVLMWYGTTYAGNEFYSYISDGSALYLYTLAVIAACIISLFKTKHFAYLALVGGYLMPILTGLSMSPVIFLGYLLLLIAGIAGLSGYKRWASVQAWSFLGTVFLSLAYFGEVYTTTYLALSFFTFIVYFGIHLATALYFAQEAEIKTGKLVLTLIPATGIWFVLVGYSLLNDSYSDFLGIFAFFVACIYFIIAVFAQKHNIRGGIDFVSAVVGVFLLTMSVFYQFDGPILTLILFAQATIMYSISFKYWFKQLRVLSALVYGIALLTLLSNHTLALGVFGWSFTLYVLAMILAYGISGYYFKALKESSDSVLPLGYRLFAGIGTLLAISIIGVQYEGVWQFTGWIVLMYGLLYVGIKISSRLLKVLSMVVYGIIVFFVFGAYQFGQSVAVLNDAFMAYIVLISLSLVYAQYFYQGQQKESAPESESLAVKVFFIFALVFSMIAITGETRGYFDQKVQALESPYTTPDETGETLGSLEYKNEYISQTTQLKQQESVVLIVLYTIFAFLVTIAGFVRNIRGIRIAGITIFFISALYIFFFIWSLGSLYRIIGSIVFGVIAVIMSFMFAKYREKIQEIV